MYLIDKSGAVLGSGTTPLLQPDQDVGRHIWLAWDGADLILAKDNQISWIAVHPI